MVFDASRRISYGGRANPYLMKSSLISVFLAWALWLGSSLPAQSQTYNFTTIAGLAGVSGSADGTNSDARFKFPSNLVVDPVGNIFVSDLNNHTIRKITPVGTNWVVTTIAGQAGVRGSNDGTNAQARFSLPHGLAVDRAGILYVADYANYLIRQITPVGSNWVVTTLAGLAGVHGSGDGPGSEARFWSPWGIAVDANTNLFVVDMANFTVRELVGSGTNWMVSTIVGTPLNFDFLDGINSAAAFNFPYGITVDAVGNLYVADSGNHAIRQITPSGPNWVVTTIAGTGFKGTNDGPGVAAQLNSPAGLTVAGTNTLLVADQSNDLIRRVTSVAGDWTVTTIAGGPLVRGTADGAGADTRFYHPWDIGVDAAGNIYITDWGNHTIRKGTPVLATAPGLEVVFSSGQLVLSWPQEAGNYILETSATLFPAGSWSPLTNGVASSGNRLVLTNAMTSPASFYRLRKP